jgi:hypothetical protein
MPHIRNPFLATISSQQKSQAKRLELRIAELDLAHDIEMNHLYVLLERTRQKFFLSIPKGA